ncbi:hypothetical protein ASPZODRAFT_23461 [Penicilliopsis zonata CBS 506.65]|uniref:1,3-beta-glucanosyltransferase n=1 Tax=Penicilliopsis zonata CBS 506.65 TaxID=1073090 RepID=A0A1L9SQ44_9EURO|nr:hypothetical protein ASPZODRAFT_23461 [Penicilliopsis zonata CBS 506.65]OJJ49197.1 hypothetical protein ASPZODRAFT_23461 [Penicilliopsis zonata CBS 506.65]
MNARVGAIRADVSDTGPVRSLPSSTLGPPQRSSQAGLVLFPPVARWSDDPFVYLSASRQPNATIVESAWVVRRTTMKWSSILAGSTLFASTAWADLDPIVIKGSKFFFNSNDTQFFIRGVAYQQEYSSDDSTSGNTTTYKDPLADADACGRDVPLLQELRTNTIRVYAIDPTLDHSECMQLLTDAGIYVIADLSDPGQSIDRSQPAWNNALYDRYVSVVDELSQYTNTIGFFAGNEVSNTKNTTAASAFVKAAVRDMKRYIKAKDYRSMGVGYATNDDSDIRVNMADYFNCESVDDSIDFWGYNVYSWCGDSSYQESGYKDRTEEFSSYSVPVFFAEYGCNTVQPRKFTEVQALFGDAMTEVWSGGIVYMYFQEANNYGLVSVDGTSASTMVDFSYYSQEIASVNPTGVQKGSYDPSNTALEACPTVDSDWEAVASPLPPSPNDDLCTCMESSLECVVKDSISSDQYGDLFDTVCGYGVCAGIDANATSGKYGAYSVCNAQQQLSYVFNLYYQQQKAENNAASACDFGGAASVTASGKAASACSTLLKEAGTSGTGTVTSSPTGTGAVSSSSATASSSKGAAHPSAMPATIYLGAWQLGIYLLTALVAGFGMVLL